MKNTCKGPVGEKTERNSSVLQFFVCIGAKRASALLLVDIGACAITSLFRDQGLFTAKHVFWRPGNGISTKARGELRSIRLPLYASVRLD